MVILSIHFMKSEKKSQVEAARMKVGSADEFLGLSAEESALVSLRLSLAEQVRRRRPQTKARRLARA